MDFTAALPMVAGISSQAWYSLYPVIAPVAGSKVNQSSLFVSAITAFLPLGWRCSAAPFASASAAA